jgi:hypothetical protein
MRWVTDGKFTSTVRLDGRCAVKDGHDTGTLILHVGNPPNAGLVLTIAFSKYKVLFGASAVKADGDAFGTYYPVLAPTLYCSNPFGVPAVVFPLHNPVPFFATVRIGMTLGDFAKGWAAVAFEMALDLLFNLIFNGFRGTLDSLKAVLAKGFSATAKAYAGKAAKGVFDEFCRALLRKMGQDTSKKAAAGMLKGIYHYLAKGKGGRIDLPVLGLGVEFEPKTGKIKIGTPGNPEQHGSIDTKSAPAGTTTELSVPDGTPHAD